MDKNSRQQPNAEQSKASVEPSLPPFQSVQMAVRQPEVGFAQSRSIPKPMSLAGASAKMPAESDIIDKEAFFREPASAAVASLPDAKPSATSNDASNWVPKQLRPVPAFYPLERSSRFVEDDLHSVAARLSEANRVLSVYAMYDNETATASLLTAENVEMHLSLWKTAASSKNPEGIVVELQRRKGDSIAFHRYSRYLLGAAVGEFNPQEHFKGNLQELDVVYSKKVQRVLNLDAGKDAASEKENAIIAIEIAHGLLMKDRMDARQLGLESLCLLTDPKKTGFMTAIIASHVVLLGTAEEFQNDKDDSLMMDEGPFQEIRETILSLIQLRRIGDSDAPMDDEAHVEDEEHMTVLHNLALAVLANALDVIENEEKYEDAPEPAAAAVAGAGNTKKTICESFLSDAKEVTEREILKTLIQELGKAEQKPHNACLSAKCIGSLCRASEEARKRAKELGAKNVVQTALDVGTRTHMKLETECKKVTETLNAVVPDEEQQRNE